MEEPAQEPQQFCLRWNNHQSTIVGIFDTLYRTEALVDCQIAVEGGIVYKAHRVVLSACSPFFADLLKTYNDQMYPTIVVCGIGANEIEAIMSYMYRGEVNISQERLASLLRIAEFLKIKGLSEGNASRGSGGHQQQQQQQQLLQTLQGVSSNKRQRISSVPGIDSEIVHDDGTSPRRRRRGIRRRSQDNNDNSNLSALQTTIDPASGGAGAGYSSIPHYAAGALGLAPAGSSPQIAASPLSVSVTKKTESSSSGKSVSAVVGLASSSDATNVQTAKLANAGDDHNQQQESSAIISKNIAADKSSSSPSAANHQKQQKSATTTSGNNSNREPSTSAAAAAAAAQQGTEMVIEPKAEYVDDGNEENVEDLTLDDEDITAMEDMDQAAGTSQAGEGSSQSYANWQHERSNQDDIVLAAQEGQQRDPQGKENALAACLANPAISVQFLAGERRGNNPDNATKGGKHVDERTARIAVKPEFTRSSSTPAAAQPVYGCNDDEPLRPRFDANPPPLIGLPIAFLQQKLQQQQLELEQERVRQHQRQEEEARQRQLQQQELQCQKMQEQQMQIVQQLMSLINVQANPSTALLANMAANMPDIANRLPPGFMQQETTQLDFPLPLTLPTQTPLASQPQLPLPDGSILKSLLTRSANHAVRNSTSYNDNEPTTSNTSMVTAMSDSTTASATTYPNRNSMPNLSFGGMQMEHSNHDNDMRPPSELSSSEISSMEPLNLAEAVMTNGDANYSSSAEKRSKPEGNYPCLACGKVYRWKSTLRRHIKNECGGKEPMFKCYYCNHASKQRGNLGVHIRKHHPEKDPLENKRKKGRNNKAEKAKRKSNHQTTSAPDGTIDLNTVQLPMSNGLSSMAAFEYKPAAAAGGISNEVARGNSNFVRSQISAGTTTTDSQSTGISQSSPGTATTASHSSGISGKSLETATLSLPTTMNASLSFLPQNLVMQNRD